MLSNVSSLVNAKWYLGTTLRRYMTSLLTFFDLGIPFNETDHFRLDIAQYGESILGDNLIGLQVGETPDTYASKGVRPYVRFIVAINSRNTHPL